MSSIVSVKLSEWTHGLDSSQSLISVFENIRDIPYSVAVAMGAPKTAPEQILTLGKGSCSPKHYLLAEMYRKLGFEVVYATFPFLWNDPDIHYPPEIRRLAAGLPVSLHLACRVRINNRWVLVDATWDPPLKRGGFPVNEHWDGRSDTRCAVKPLRSAIRTAYCRTATNEPCRDGSEVEFNPLDGELDHGDAEGRARYYRKKAGILTEKENWKIRLFYQKFDAWLEILRR